MVINNHDRRCFSSDVSKHLASPSIIQLLFDHQWLLFHWGQWTLIIFYPLLHVALILTPWNVPFLAFMIPAPCASLPISHPCVLGILCRLLITTRVWILMSQGLSFTLLSPHTFWAALRFSTFCLHPLYVLAPCFQILSRSVLFNMAPTRCMWLLTFKSIKIQQNKISAPQLV